MNQDHIILIFMFPESSDEYAAPYTSDELETAKADAKSFVEMYDEVLYVAVAYAYSDGREEEVFRWNNPRSSQLLKEYTLGGRNAGAGAGLGYPMSPGSALVAGLSSQTSSNKSSRSPKGARPPSVEQYEAPPPSASKTYGGRPRRRTGQRSGRRR